MLQACQTPWYRMLLSKTVRHHLLRRNATKTLMDCLIFRWVLPRPWRRSNLPPSSWCPIWFSWKNLIQSSKPLKVFFPPFPFFIVFNCFKIYRTNSSNVFLWEGLESLNDRHEFRWILQSYEFIFLLVIEIRSKINQVINKFMNADPLTSELLNTTVENLMMASCIKNPSVFIRYSWTE